MPVLFTGTSPAVGPTWAAVAVSETLRKVCIDVFVQRLGVCASAAGMYKLAFSTTSTVNGRASIVSLYGLPVCMKSHPTPVFFQFRLQKHKFGSYETVVFGFTNCCLPSFVVDSDCVSSSHV
ncbi:hypothetical protein PRUPE_2G262300 [Prunus persica]|uniref:Uncharacterized protein n=1 Tax=Prunus persica TaxID=3760 RepID=A0A251QQ30_PRUPE|nr:hypothetical protein PRUPE_2G262300 [Prunus persica]